MIDSRDSSLISVIIPIYKAEKWLRQCIDSVINQTYSNLEIILIDDGSPDNCPQICDEYALKDNRIKVIHRQNGGVSSARNVGINICKGDYISFVDSDDWIEDDMYEEFMVLLSHNPDVDVFQFNFYWWDEKNNLIEPHYYEPQDEQIFTSYQSLCNMLNCKIVSGSIGGKIFSANCVKTVRFVDNVLSEDFVFISSVFANAKYMLCNPSKLYNYRLISTSRSHGEINEAAINLLYYLENQKEQARDNTMQEHLNYFQLVNAFVLYNRILKEQTYEDKKMKIRNCIRDCYKNLSEKRKINWKNRLWISLLLLNAKLYKVIYLSYMGIRTKKKYKL